VGSQDRPASPHYGIRDLASQERMVYEVGHATLTGGENAFASRVAQSLVCVPSPSILDLKGNLAEDPQRRKAAAASSTIDDNPYPVEKEVEFA
jgi:hypothetical protein